MSTNTVKLIDRIGLSLLESEKSVVILSWLLNTDAHDIRKEINHLEDSGMIKRVNYVDVNFFKLTKAGVKWAKGTLDKPT